MANDTAMTKQESEVMIEQLKKVFEVVRLLDGDALATGNLKDLANADGFPLNKNFDLERFNDSISAMMACKASIKAGDPISMEEMKTLIERLKKCENPFNCAHGRPTIIHNPKYELDKLFKRAV